MSELLLLFGIMQGSFAGAYSIYYVAWMLPLVYVGFCRVAHVQLGLLASGIDTGELTPKLLYANPTEDRGVEFGFIP